MVYNNLRFFFSFDSLSLSQNFQGFFSIIWQKLILFAFLVLISYRWPLWMLLWDYRISSSPHNTHIHTNKHMRKHLNFTVLILPTCRTYLLISFLEVMANFPSVYLFQKQPYFCSWFVIFGSLFLVFVKLIKNWLI